jgi:hypothetical protein
MDLKVRMWHRQVIDRDCTAADKTHHEGWHRVLSFAVYTYKSVCTGTIQSYIHVSHIRIVILLSKSSTLARLCCDQPRII